MNRQIAKDNTEGINKSPKSFTSWILPSLFILLTVCGGLVWIIRDWANYNPAEYPANLTRALLKAVSTQQNILPPTELPADVRGVDKACWNYLKEAMDKNASQYRLETRTYGDYGTPDPSNMTGSNEVVVTIIFQDSSKVELYFYISFLEECRPLTKGAIPFFSTLSTAP